MPWASDPDRAAAVSDEAVSIARSGLEATVAYLDQLGLNDIAAHASLALDRLNEYFPVADPTVPLHLTEFPEAAVPVAGDD